MNAITLRGPDLQRAVAQFNDQLATRAEQFKMVLPSHIKPDKFQRTLLTAVQSNPDLLNSDRQSLLTSCMKAAQDGLLPDGREAALVKFSTRQKIDGQWVIVALVQYMPMAFGLRKKILQSGEVKDIFAAVVYRQEIETGRFIYEEGSERMLRHKPLLDPEFDPTDDDIALAYSVATFADGTKSFEVMRRGEINKVRQVSQTGATGRTDRQGNAIEPKGPWVDWFSEMAKKTVMRRHSKFLPMSGDILLDVEGDDIDAASRSAVAALDARPGGRPQAIEDHSDETPAHDPDTGELTGESVATDQQETAAEDQPTGGADEGAPAEPEQANSDDQPTDELGVTRTPGEIKAEEIVAEVKAAISIMDVNSIESRSRPDIEAMDDDVAAYVRQIISARKAEITAAHEKARKQEAATE
jgi:recombination protein RecT